MADLSVADPHQEMIRALMQQMAPAGMQQNQQNPQMQQNSMNQMMNQAMPSPSQAAGMQQNMLTTPPPMAGKDQSRFMAHPFPPSPNMGQPILPQGF